MFCSREGELVGDSTVSVDHTLTQYLTHPRSIAACCTCDDVVCRGIVELHGGTISVASEGIGMGSCFSVEIPVVHDLLTSPANTQQTASKSNHIRSSVASLLMNFREYSFHSFFANTVIYERLVLRSSRVGDQPLPRTSSPNASRHQSTVKHSVDLVHYNSTGPASHQNVNNLPFIDEKQHDAMLPIKRGRVLIVDDVALNRKMLKRLLVTRFEECKEAENGQQAVDMVKDTMLSGLIYDVIMMDYQMPIMDGVTASSSIRKLGYRGHIIGVTGNALQDDVNLFLANGADKVLTKPLSVATLDEYLSTIS